MSCSTLEETDRTRCREALTRAGLWEKIAGLPQKEETYLGKDMTDDGVTLSGGEMQKLMMARALYKNCRLLLLDEPTAALDAISENEMYETYSTLLKKWQLRLPPLQMLYMQVLVAIVVLFPLYLASPPVGPTVHNMGLVLYAFVLASMIAPLAWMKAVATLGPSRTTLFFNLLPLITALIAAVVLKEQLHAYHLIGGALTLGGVILSERWTTPLRAA